MTHTARNEGATAGGSGTVPPAPPFARQDLVRLPGPRRHLDRLEQDLRAGLNCVWYFPDTVVESGRADFFLRELMGRLEESVPVPGSIASAEDGARAAGSGTIPFPAQRSAGATPDGPPARDPFDPWHEEDDGFDTDDPYGALLGSAATASAPVVPGAGIFVPQNTASPMSLIDRLAKELGVTDAPLNELLRRAHRCREGYPADDPDDEDDGSAPDSPPTVVVRGWEEHSAEEIGQLFRAAHAAFREAGLSAERRPRFLFAARVRDLPSKVFGVGLGPSDVTVHWWWRVWTRLDSEVLLAWRPRPPATAAQALLDRVTDAVVAEVCGPDVDRALVLREVWKGGDVESLRRALAATLPDPGKDPGRNWSRRMSTAHASLPSAEIRDAWETGSVDSWDGRVRPVLAHHLLDPDSNELHILVCHAQNRVLLPLIEEARISLTEVVPGLLRRGIALDYFRDQARSDYQVRNRLPAAPLAELEIGDLSRAARLLVLSTDQQDRLRTLSKARNHLSHLQPLGQEKLVAVTKALTTDWAADDES
ncbi:MULTISPECIES: hypothetical protein [unclassified Streptomyces]|uniref:hypothetical protein n=1 Tax=unclassified Streptomyces TaxID=2593676 RepID=UPI0006B052A2|nr:MULTISPECIES: hypothetical protein [unclassified Streptomyces]KOX35579.1 hypothetical protein ADL08_34835 [Streptomyces sp. NRRL F-6492]KOX38219.1 hypothetical protein ADL06_02055 [Streptomyces sp. NRRL F-6491]